jgi:hypothetical protein
MNGMVITKLLASPFAACRAVGGAWSAALACIEGRSDRLFERERRQTYQAVPRALLPGTYVYDRRADGSILEIRIPPAARTEVTIGTGDTMPAECPGARAAEGLANRALEAPASNRA